MKPALAIAICLMAACLGCAAKQAGQVPAQSDERCIKCFPAGAWRVVHRIEADFGPAGSISLIGVSQGDPARHALTSVLMTAEGFVLLEVKQSHGEQEILRALPPFDKPQMVQGMLTDVELMFMLPQGKPSIGKSSCGWNLENGDQLSAARLEDGGCHLDLKNKTGDLIRSVRMFPPWQDGFTREVELRAIGGLEYTLRLHLLRAERSAQSGGIR